MGPEVLDGVLADVNEAVIIYNRSFAVLAANARVRDMLGVDPSLLVNTVFSLDAARNPRFAGLAPLFYASLAPTVVRLTEPGANPARIRVILHEPPRAFAVSTREVRAGSEALFVKIIQDVTREEDFLKSKEDFLTIAAHELRTPMTAVQWAFDALLKDSGLAESARSVAQSGAAAAGRITATVNQLLQAAQIDEGKFGYSFAPLDLAAFLSELLSAARLHAAERGVELYFDHAGGGAARISGDVRALGLALSNVIDNAIKYSDRGGAVTVGLGSAAGQALISVTDTGVGIPAADMPRIFEKFFRASNARTRAADGSGLGLYLAKNIIEAHHGAIAVQSAVGKGSTFTISLPLIHA